jgi:hypothetical protein
MVVSKKCFLFVAGILPATTVFVPPGITLVAPSRQPAALNIWDG